MKVIEKYSGMLALTGNLCSLVGMIGSIVLMFQGLGTGKPDVMQTFFNYGMLWMLVWVGVAVLFLIAYAVVENEKNKQLAADWDRMVAEHMKTDPAMQKFTSTGIRRYPNGRSTI